MQDPVVIGIVGAPHGVGGTLRIKATADGRHLREGVQPLIDGERRRILHTRQTPKEFLIELEGIESREEVEELRGCDLILDRDELDDPEEGEFYVGDLMGLAAINEDGGKLGEVIDAFPTPAHEILVVKRGEQEFLVPLTDEHVPEVRLSEGHLLVRPPEE